MCGLLVRAGQSIRSRDDESRRLDAALALLKRRGPDGCNTVQGTDRAVLMAHTRLAINDLSSAGAQPMTNENGALVLVCNGEIYNAPELRRELGARGHTFRSTSDCEVIVHAAEEWGVEAALPRLYGMYAFVVYDVRDRILHAAVDHAAMKPLYFAQQGGALYAASDADSLRAFLPRETRLSGDALARVLTTGYIPAPHTVWRDVRKLAPGQALTWSADRGVSVWTHWRPPDRVIEPGHNETDHFNELWPRVARDHLLADTPVAVLLSGGLDSTAVACAVKDAGPACVTLALVGDDDESAAAAQTAAHLGLRHVVETMRAADIRTSLREACLRYDEPQAFGATLTMTRVADAVRRNWKAAISGDGGDEAFAGYTWTRELAQRGDQSWGPWGPTDADAECAVASAGASAQTRAAAMRSLAARSLAHAHLQAIFPRFHPQEAAHLLCAAEPDADEDGYAAFVQEELRDELPLLRRLQRLDLTTFCAGAICPKIDRASASIGLEIRAPFLDRRLLDWAIARPVREEELADGSSKPLVRGCLRGRAPASTLARPKQGFSLRTDVQSQLPAMLDDVDRSKLVTTGLLASDWRRFVEPDTPHAAGRTFALGALAQWLETRI